MSNTEKKKESLESWCLKNNPGLLDEWLYSVNTLDPKGIGPKCNKKAYWACKKKGHPIVATVASRTKGSGCPYCSGYYAFPGETDLLTLRKDIAKDWDQEQNDRSPIQVTLKSGYEAHWRCEKGHECIAFVYQRVKSNGCPICSDIRLDRDRNNLRLTDPEIADEWHPTQNREKTPEQTSRGSKDQVYWLCKNNHCQCMKIYQRVQNGGCAICRETVLIPDVNDLESQRPDLCKELVKTSLPKPPSSYRLHSPKRAQWKCSRCGNLFCNTISHRVDGEGCPHCKASHKSSFPEYAIGFYLKSLAPQRNIKPDYLEGLELDIYFEQYKTGIEYDGYKFHKDHYEKDSKKVALCSLNGIHLIRVRESGLPDIDGCTIIHVDREPNQKALNLAIKEVIRTLSKIINRELVADVDVRRDNQAINRDRFLSEIENSVVKKSRHLLKEWDWTQNTLDPKNVPYRASNVDIVWKCNKGHQWIASPYTRVKGHGCPKCYNRNIEGETDIESQRPDLLPFWSPNNKVPPSKVKCGSHTQYLWYCPDCGQEYWMEARGKAIKNHGCPVCQNKYIIPGYNDLASNNEELAKEWHPTQNNDLKPTQVGANSGKKVCWLGKCGHEWRAPIIERNHGRAKCPICYPRKGKDLNANYQTFD